MTDPVQQARDALERWESIPGDPTDEEVDLAVSIRVLIAHVEALEAKQARLIDPADLEAIAKQRSHATSGRHYVGLTLLDGEWRVEDLDYAESTLLSSGAYAAEAVRAARGAQP